jgi:hypothetical protein
MVVTLLNKDKDKDNDGPLTNKGCQFNTELQCTALYLKGSYTQF